MSGSDALAMTPELLEALEGLRDLQLAPALGAEAAIADSGWVLALLLIAGAAWLRWRRHPRQRALAVLQRLHRDFSATGNAGRYVNDLAVLLRLAASSGRGAPEFPPGIAGPAWLAWLDQRAPAADCGSFSAGPGRLLTLLPFVPSATEVAEPAEIEALHGLSTRWLRANL